jgi:septal ring factor EnvC (AmiA/AmiB activator)
VFCVAGRRGADARLANIRLDRIGRAATGAVPARGLAARLAGCLVLFAPVLVSLLILASAAAPVWATEAESAEPQAPGLVEGPDPAAAADAAPDAEAPDAAAATTEGSTTVVAKPPEATAAKDPAAEALARKQAREDELARLSKALEVSRERQSELAHEIEALDKDRATLNETLIATARRISLLEQAVASADRRLRQLRDSEASMRLSLADRRAVLIEILAALERFGRRPPPALVVSPDDARTALRSALLLATALPQVKVEAEALAADLDALDRLVAEVARQRTTLEADLVSLGEERTRISLLVEEKRKLRTDQREELAGEQIAAEALADQARSLRDLVAAMEREISAAREAAAAASAAPGGARPAAADANRLAPAVAFVETRGRLPLPAGGTLTAAFGEPDGEGGRRQGISIACAPGAQVTAPADGWVVYAGPFRSYRQILILNVGDAYHIVLAGMDRIEVGLGQFVLAGEPVGFMGSGNPLRTVAAGSEPGGGAVTAADGSDLYVEFRKGGAAIDPAPWWAARQEEEVRG